MNARTLSAAVAIAAAVVVMESGVASAQSAIAGVVKDATGAVLPGVAVEAASPVLIERVRSVLTDREGLYKIVDLRPGTYVVTFTLPGFSTIKREGLELPAAFTATVNADLRIGGVEETITVSGAAPTVDIHNVLQQKVIEKVLLDSLPATRSPQAFIVFTPGITSVRLGGIAGGRDEYLLAIHGGRGGESLITIDGDKLVFTGGTGGTTQAVRYNQATIEEISVQTGATSAEQQTSAIVSNIIPKEGGNRFSGYLTASYSGSDLQFDNLSDSLKARGLTSVNKLLKLYEVTPAVGGPLVQNRLWFYSAFRKQTSIQSRAGLYQDTNPTDWVYTPDFSRQLENRIDNPDLNTRLTVQVSPKNKVNLFFQSQNYYQANRNFQNLTANEATNRTKNTPNTFAQFTWKSPASSRLLLEAGVSSYHFDRDQRRQTNVDFTTVPAQELGGQFPGIFFRSSPFNSTDLTYGRWDNASYDFKGSASYVTGRHAFKSGVYLRRGWSNYTNEMNGDLGVTLLNGVPTSLTLASTPWLYRTLVKADLGLYAQDQWKLNRVTVNVGVRYDYFRGEAAATDLPATRWVPARKFTGVENVPNWKDVSPRLGMVYDIFGDGKTAAKVSLGRYVAAEGTGTATANHPLNRSVLSVTRTWTDRDGDFVPDCDLLNPLAQNAATVDVCGQISNLNFGLSNPNATTYDDDLIHGFGKRGYNWMFSAEIQREISRALGVAVGYYRRSYGNFTATNNLLVTPADYDTYCVAAPSDPQLPGGGGYQVCGLYDVTPTLFGRVQNQVTAADNFGKQTEIYNGIDVTGRLRLSNGLQVSGGMNTGRTETNRCFVIDSPQQLQYCDVKPPFQPNFKFTGVYPLPWFGLQSSAVFQLIPGPQITATYTARNAQIVPSLLRNLASGANGTVSVELIEPGTVWADASKQLDLRLSRRMQFGKARLLGNVDLFNVFNAGGIQTLSTAYGTAGTGWLTPTLVQSGRSMMFGGQLEF